MRTGASPHPRLSPLPTRNLANLHVALDRVRSLRSIKLEPYQSVLVGCLSLVPTTPPHDCFAGAAGVRRDGTSDRLACADRWRGPTREPAALSSSSSVYRPRSTRILRIRCVSGLR